MAGESRPTPAALPMISICAWCSDSREKTAAAIAQGYSVSHGLCPACAVKVDAEMKAAG